MGMNQDSSVNCHLSKSMACDRFYGLMQPAGLVEISETAKRKEKIRNKMNEKRKVLGKNSEPRIFDPLSSVSHERQMANAKPNCDAVLM